MAKVVFSWIIIILFVVVLIADFMKAITCKEINWREVWLRVAMILSFGFICSLF